MIKKDPPPPPKPIHAPPPRQSGDSGGGAPLPDIGVITRSKSRHRKQLEAQKRKFAGRAGRGNKTDDKKDDE